MSDAGTVRRVVVGVSGSLAWGEEARDRLRGAFADALGAAPADLGPARY
ncbi:hypothetical protein [Streptomyces gardneri]